MDTQENMVPNEPVVKEGDTMGARLVAGLVIVILAAVLIIAIVPGWKEVVLDALTVSKEERLLNAVNKLGAKIPEGERLSEEELIEEVNRLGTQTLSPGEAEALLEGIRDINN